MRGVSGVGKSSFIEDNIPDPKAIHSIDDIIINALIPNLLGKKDVVAYTETFMDLVNSHKLLYMVHHKNFDNAKSSMDAGVENVVIDNVNLNGWESKRYVVYGIEKGYEVVVHNIPYGDATAEELVERNIHGIPLEGIQAMMEVFDANPEMTVEDILAIDDSIIEQSEKQLDEEINSCKHPK